MFSEYNKEFHLSKKEYLMEFILKFIFKRPVDIL